MSASLSEASARHDAGLGLIDRRLIEAFLDREQQVAFLDVGAFGEQPLLEEAVDAGAQIDLVDRLDPAGEAILRADILLDGLDHGDGGRRAGRGLRLLAVAASGQGDCEPE